MKCPALPERLSPTRHDPAGAAVLVAPATCGPDRAPGRAPRGSAAHNTGPGGPSRESPVRTRRPAGEWGWGGAGRPRLCRPRAFGARKHQLWLHVPENVISQRQGTCAQCPHRPWGRGGAGPQSVPEGLGTDPFAAETPLC